MPKNKVFICYHHANDQYYKEMLNELNRQNDIFIDRSVNTGDIDDSLESHRIREIIRDKYLRDSTVTILLAGTETKKRKHVDWELYSSMINGKVNRKSGILVVNLPTVNCSYFTAAHDGEKEQFYPTESSWISIDSRAEYARRYPHLPDRIIDNLINKEAKISVINWDKIINDIEGFRSLINQTCENRLNNTYDLHRKMRRANA